MAAALTSGNFPEAVAIAGSRTFPKHRITSRRPWAEPGGPPWSRPHRLWQPPEPGGWCWGEPAPEVR